MTPRLFREDCETDAPQKSSMWQQHGPLRIGMIAVRNLVDRVLESKEADLRQQRIQVEVDVPAIHRVAADSEMLRRSLVNLIQNAMDVMPRGGELIITSYLGPHSFELEVADSGPGLSDEARRQAFDPYYTTKELGTGVGLSVVRQLVAAHGGQVMAKNCPQGGAAFTISLPRRMMQAAA